MGQLQMAKHTFADLFSGCGGFSLGLMQAGMQGVFAVERDAMAFETFAWNLLSPAGRQGSFAWPDWLEAKPWDIEALLIKHRLDLKAELRGKVDVLAGGPPCQGFSFAGRRHEDDPRNLLFQKYVEVVSAIRPKVLVLENVPGMKVVHRSNVVRLTPGTANVPRRSFYDKLVESLASVGYSVAGKLVDASEFGVPQRRTRLIVVGMQKELAEQLGGVSHVFDVLEKVRRLRLKELGTRGKVSARAAISDLEVGSRPLRPCSDPALRGSFSEVTYSGPRTAYQKLMHAGYDEAMDSMRLANHRDDVRERFFRIITECAQGVRMDDASRRRFGLRKHRIYPMAAYDPAPTVTTLPDDILHYCEPRILTVREYARLQSFPDWFHFKGKYTTGGKRRTSECPRYTQVGNAVPPLLAQTLGLAISKVIEEAEGIDAKSRTADQMANRASAPLAWQAG